MTDLEPDLMCGHPVGAFGHVDGCPDDDDRERVNCDDGCGAFLEPETPEEMKDAMIHWREHAYLWGCSHAR